MVIEIMLVQRQERVKTQNDASNVSVQMYKVKM
jgi:hypothetical protein